MIVDHRPGPVTALPPNPGVPALGESLPSERDPGLRSFERCALAQSDWLQRLAAFHVVGQCAAHVSHKSALILGIAQAS